jgi:hypothetical protein
MTSKGAAKLAGRLLDLRRRFLTSAARGLLVLVCAAARSSYCFSSTAELFLYTYRKRLVDQYRQFGAIMSFVLIANRKL